MSCYYTSWEQCKATMSGIGGLCVESPYYHPQPTQLPHRTLVKPRQHRQDRTVRGSMPERLEVDRLLRAAANKGRPSGRPLWIGKCHSDNEKDAAPGGSAG